MMSELGDYAAEVLSAYGVSIALLAIIVAQSFRRARRARADLERVEGRRDG